MSAAMTLRGIRQTSGLGLRELARRAGTSHATLHAYESGAKEPRFETVVRIADAAGLSVDVVLSGRPDAGTAARMRKGRELVDALELAAAFPVRHRARLRAPVFGRTS